MHKILGITEDTPQKQARKEWLKLTRIWHPKKQPDAPKWVLMEINNAYTTLFKEDKLDQFDETWKSTPTRHGNCD